jgi:hypothetical protein
MLIPPLIVLPSDIWITARLPIILAIIAILYQLAVFILGRKSRAWLILLACAWSAVEAEFRIDVCPCRGLPCYPATVWQDRGDARVVLGENNLYYKSHYNMLYCRTVSVEPSAALRILPLPSKASPAESQGIERVDLFGMTSAPVQLRL